MYVQIFYIYMGYTFHASNDYCNNINIPARAVHYIMFFMACTLQLILYSPHSRVLKVLKSKNEPNAHCTH